MAITIEQAARQVIDAERTELLNNTNYNRQMYTQAAKTWAGEFAKEVLRLTARVAELESALKVELDEAEKDLMLLRKAGF